jgi:hypothetical protein
LDIATTNITTPTTPTAPNPTSFSVEGADLLISAYSAWAKAKKF